MRSSYLYRCATVSDRAQLQTLQVLESELKTLPSDAVSDLLTGERHADIKHLLTSLLLRRQKVYNAIATPLEAPLIAHAHGQHAFFPNLDAKTSLQDVQREYHLPRHSRFRH